VSGFRDIPVDDLNDLEAVAELKDLAEEIARHDKAYHQEDAPKISDAVYDALRRRNEEIEARFPHLVRKDSPSQKVGAAAARGFAKITHAKPMLSLGNVFSDEELTDFVAGVRRFLRELQDDESIGLDMVAEPKIDGLSISLRYEKGNLVHAATRGDGAVGEDVTENVRTFKDLPFILRGEAPDVIDVRGEVYLTKSDFQALNQRQEDSGSKVLPTPGMRQPAPCVSSIRPSPPPGL